MLDDVGYAQFQRTVKRLIGVDLASYRQGQMRRRLEALVQRVGSGNFTEYAKLLERDPARLQEFRDYFTINVTEFFRDAERFRYLETKVLPALLASRSGLRVWSAACSTGPEPYSVAMLLKELSPLGAHKVLATDVDRTVLDRARRGDGYLAADVRNVTPPRLQRCFTTAPNGTYAVKPEIKALVEFREHDLLGPAPGQQFDLVLCRNVVIYFTDDAKRGLYERLANALRPGGALFVGGTEMIPGASALDLASAGPSFYRREPAPAVPAPALARAGTRF